LGHAARMIHVARELQKRNFNVFIGSGEQHMSLFRAELSGLSYIDFEGFRPGYSRYMPQYAAMLFKIPQLLYHIIREHRRLKYIIRDYEIDIVISDNRFGLWNSEVTTVYVTHMPKIPFPGPFRFLEFTGVLLHRAIIRRYNFCFIPDLPGEDNLTGRLSHGFKLPANVRFTGILSRFIPEPASQREKKDIMRYNTIILSGPEPQRTILKFELVSLLKDSETASIFLEGRPEITEEKVRSGNITYHSHLPASEMKNLLIKSNSIICRSGYTTIMELVSLNCSALLIPTPGQTEQEYLAEYLSGKGWFSSIPQRKIKNGIILPPMETVWSPSEILSKSKVLLKAALDELSDKRHEK
jgi:hypothetical protein